MIKVAMVGALGRMGSLIIRTIAREGDMQIVAAIDSTDNPNIGKDIGKLLGIGNIDVKLTPSNKLDETLKASVPDVLADFTIADAAVETAKIASRNRVNLVIGTTGFDESQVVNIKSSVQDSGVSAVMSPNMATGVNIFFTMVQAAASIYEGADVEIIEAHHKNKKDSPSGTAIRAGELVAKAMGKDLDKDGLFGRGRGLIGERGNEIGFHTIRGGDIVGEHTVMLMGDGERLEITHRTHTRQALVSGTIKAIRFVNNNKSAGKVFSTFDVLGL